MVNVDAYIEPFEKEELAWAGMRLINGFELAISKKIAATKELKGTKV